jgi:hypothetical protein
MARAIRAYVAREFASGLPPVSSPDWRVGMIVIAPDARSRCGWRVVEYRSELDLNL